MITEEQREAFAFFFVPGVPMPQGSKTGFIIGGRVRLVEGANKATKNRKANALQKWRDSVAYCASYAYKGEPVKGPIALSANFRFKRPKSHYTSKGELTKSARLNFPCMTSKPDLSKLVRAIEDALSGITYSDDSKVVCYSSIWKRWCQGDETPGVEIGVFEL